MIRPARPADAAAVADVWLRSYFAERTDGANNEEREPDVRYVWRP